MSVIDVYGHVSLPRFLSVEEFLRVMDEHDVEAAALSTADTCPDVQELSRALVAHPDRFRVVGMPLGAGPAHLRDSIRAQLDSGFSGIRLPAGFVAGNPDVLDIIGQAGAFALFVGENGLSAIAAEVSGFLDSYPRSFAIAGHFGGPADPSLLDTDPAVGRLFAHPSLHVAFTRHGALRHLPVDAWARGLIGRFGWQRILWGSEWPVALWRNETYASTLAWAERFDPTAEQRQAYCYGNARRLLFGSGPVRAETLGAEWDLTPYRKQADVWLFPPSLDVPEERHRRLVQAYSEWGGERRGLYSEFMLEMAERGISAAGLGPG